MLSVEQLRLDAPGPGQVRLRQTAIGLNYVDTYYRTGLYKAPLPSGIGFEAAGIVETLGEGVVGLRPGDRVVYAIASLGAYARLRNVPAERLVKVPDDIADQQAAAIMLQGMTAHYLLRRVYPVQPGDTILVHAAAGGVGLILCQWAASLGATVIGTVGTQEKAELARANGCTHTILYRSESLVERVRDLTNGAKLRVVYDSVGRDTFASSMDCLQPFGLLVSFGQSSGAIGPFDTRILAEKGSLYLTRPTLWTYIARREDLVASASELMAAVSQGIIKPRISRTLPLAEAAQAHRDLHSRKTVGKTLLIP
jgi:NADPH2:quinone reductase